MAQEDYLSQSAFGTAAGGLLSRKDDLEEKDFYKLVMLSSIEQVLKGLQIKQKKDTLTAVNEINDNYKDIFTNNQEVYNLQSKNRAEYQNYLEDKNAYLDAKEIELFNKDPNVRSENISYGDINNLDPESKKHALQVAANFRKQAEERIVKLGENPAVNIPTFTQFNQLAKNEGKAALAVVQDDPAKQSLTRAALNKVFGYGAGDQAALSKALEDAQNLRLEQDKKVSPNETVTAKDNLNNSILFADNKKAALSIKASDNDYFDYVTTEEKLKLDRDNFRKKVNTAGYEFTLEDMHKSGELGVELPGLSGFNNVMSEQRPTLVSAFKKARVAAQNGQHPLEVLDGAEANVYAIAIGTTVEQYKGQQIALELNELKLDSLRNPEVKTIGGKDVAAIVDPNNQERALVENVMSQVIAEQREGSAIVDLQNIIDNKMFGKEKQALISNIMIQQRILEQDINRYKGPSAYNDSLRDAISAQLMGIYLPAGAKETLFDDDIYRFETVEPRHFRLVNEDITSTDMAKELVDALNTKYYMQSMVMPDTEGNTITLFPDEVGKSFVEQNAMATFEFYVEQLDENDPQSLVWNYRIINN